MTDLVPILETERTVMRGWRDQDLDSYAAIAADPEVNRFLASDSLDRAEAWRRIAQFLGHWQLRGYGLWAVERKSDGELLGRVGLWNPEGWPGIEIGWILARHAWGQGYAYEAASAAMEWGWTALELEKLISVIHPDNVRSIRLAERLGETLRGEWMYRGSIRTVIYGIDRPATA